VRRFALILAVVLAVALLAAPVSASTLSRFGGSADSCGVSATLLSVVKTPGGDALYYVVHNGLDRPIDVTGPSPTLNWHGYGPPPQWWGAFRTLLPGEDRILRFADGHYAGEVSLTCCWLNYETNLPVTITLGSWAMP